MINANKEILENFFHSKMEYIIPFFQRAYVWDKDNWEALWDNIKSIELEHQNNQEHFIGTIIVKQKTSKDISENKFDIIDGQQRITTIAILLKAIESNHTDKDLKQEVRELIIFKRSGKEYIRIQHNKTDKPYFETILLDKSFSDLSNKNHRILKAYEFFKEKTKNHDDNKLENLKYIILKKIPVISMLLHENDDEQIIFDTINSLGVRLTIAELLKNYIFNKLKDESQENDLHELYKNYWEGIFESDEYEEFWNRPKISGRIPRTNIEILLYCFLIIQTKKAVKIENLFKEYKNWLRDKTKDDIVKNLEELKKYAEFYYSFFSEVQELDNFNEKEKLFFHIMESFQMTTIYPLILFMKSKTEKEGFKACIQILQSYIIRRKLCNLPAKNYNNSFITIMKKIDQNQKYMANKLKDILSESKEDTYKFPDNKEFEESFLKQKLTNKDAKEILFCIALYQNKNNELHDTENLKKARDYSLEHILPKKWKEHWNNPKLSIEDEIKRNEALKAIGNLTLTTQKLNSKLGNQSWDKKKNTLKQYSKLRMTLDYLDEETWNEKEIENRGKELAKIAQKIWINL